MKPVMGREDFVLVHATDKSKKNEVVTYTWVCSKFLENVMHV